MRTTSDRFDLAAFISATERDHDKMNERPETSFGDSEAHDVLLTKVISYDHLEDFSSGWSIGDIEDYMAIDGSTIFSPFAYENQEARLVDCIDGKRRRILQKDDFSLGEMDALGFLLERRGEDFEILPAILCGGACPGPIPTIASVPLSSHFWDAMINYIERYVKE
jgi:hypothetical protein